MYGTTYLVPLFLAQVRGYNAFEIGLTIIVTGLVTMAMSPLSTGIARLLDLRAMLAIGFGLSACGHSEGDRAITGGALGAGEVLRDLGGALSAGCVFLSRTG